MPRTDQVRRWAALLIPAGIVIGADQTAKHLIVQHLALGESITPIPILADIFAITRSHNTGAALGILPQMGDVFLFIAVALVVGIGVFYPRFPAGRWPERIALGMLLGGTLGNALDRLEFGFVIDWVHFRIPGLVSNVSNFADHAIVLAVLVLFIAEVRAGRRESSTPATPPPTPESGSEPR